MEYHKKTLQVPCCSLNLICCYIIYAKTQEDILIDPISKSASLIQQDVH